MGGVDKMQLLLGPEASKNILSLWCPSLNVADIYPFATTAARQMLKLKIIFITLI